MSRTIKFRAWNEKKMKMTNCTTLKDMCLKASDSLFHWDDEVPIMQFTGLKDSKGKEIYEGDIVSEYRLNETFRKYTVQYDNDTARFELVNKKMGWRHGVNIGGALYFLINDVSPLEVIGNIYENSELL